MAEIVPYNLPHFPHPCGSDAGGASPWMHPRVPSLPQHPRAPSLPQAAFTLAQFTLGGGRTMQEQLLRATHGAVVEYGNDAEGLNRIYVQCDLKTERLVVS